MIVESYAEIDSKSIHDWKYPHICSAQQEKTTNM